MNYSTMTTETANPMTAMFTPKSAISYLRVSSRRQAERGGGDDEGFSIPAQREANKKKAAGIGAIIVKEFVDRGASAKSADRKDLQDMLRYIAENRVDYVIVHKVDRLARNRDDDSDITRVLRQHGVKLVSTSEAIDETPSGMLLHGIMSSIAEFYSRNLAAEVMKGMGQKAQNGGTVSRAPIGYMNVRHTDDKGRELRTVELDSERAPLISLAFKMYAAGDWVVSDLAEYLALRGLTTKPTPRVPSKPVDKSALSKVLVNPYYKGMVRFNGKYHTGTHEPLVDEDTWHKVQDVLASHINGERTREHPHFLKSAVYCKSCGSRLIIQYARSRSGLRYPYYSCAGRHNKRTDCRQKSVLISEVERQIELLYDRISFTPEMREQLQGWFDTETDKAAHNFESERRELELEQDKLERKQKKLLETYYADAIPIDLFKNEQDAIRDALAAISARIDAHGTHYGEIKEKFSLALELIEDCGKAYRQAPEQIKRAFNQAIFERILIGPDGDTSPVYAAPYDLIFDQQQTNEKTDSPDENGTVCIADLLRKYQNTAKKLSHFLGRCFSKDFLVETTGLEPATSRV